MSDYSLDFLKRNYRETRTKIERDLEQRIGQLPLVTQRLLSLVPIEQLEEDKLYLPKYSPDLNPIEHQWHRIKQRVRKTMTSITQNLHDLIDSVICISTFACLAIGVGFLSRDGHMLEPNDLTHLVKELSRFRYGAVGVVGYWGCYIEKVAAVNFTDKIWFSQKFCIRGLARWKTVV